MASAIGLPGLAVGRSPLHYVPRGCYPGVQNKPLDLSSSNRPTIKLYSHHQDTYPVTVRERLTETP